MATVIAYVRAAGDTSPPLALQEAALRRWARANHHRVVAVTTDSDDAEDSRQGLVEALSLLRTGQAACLLVQRMEVLGDEVVMQEQLVEEIRRIPARVLVVETPETAPSGSGGLSRHVVRKVLREAAENEPLIVALRSRANGLATSAGSPAFGFRVADGERLTDEDEQAALARIAELRAQGATLRMMARTLDAEGHRPKRSDRWHPESIRRILNRLDA